MMHRKVPFEYFKGYLDGFHNKNKVTLESEEYTKGYEKGNYAFLHNLNPDFSEFEEEPNQKYSSQSKS